MAKTAACADCFLKRFDTLDLGPNHFLQDKLSQACSAFDRVRFFAEVDKRQADDAAIIAVDRSGGIHESNALFKRQAASRTNLTLVTMRDRDGNTGGDQFDLAWMDHEIPRNIRAQIEASRALGFVSR